MTSIAIEHAPRLSLMELRQQLGGVVERVYYQFQQYQITRKDKPMARLVNEDYMRALEHLIASDPALADTLALMLNEEAMQIIEQGEAEWRAGQRIPLEKALL